VIVVNTLHVVAQVPLARESVSRNSTLTALINTKERLIAMAVESVGLTLMAEEASSRREAGALARLSLAAVGLQVRVNKFAGRVSTHHLNLQVNNFLLIVALELLRSVTAAGLAFPGAVVKSILKGSSLLVKVMITGRLAVAVLATGTSESRSGRKVVKRWDCLSGDILRDQRNGLVEAKVVLVRNRTKCHYLAVLYVPR
jgi:hypothetical protein